MERHFARPGLRQLPKIVDPVAVIRMIVRYDHPIDAGCPGRQQLLSKVRPAVDQQRLAPAFDQYRRPRSPVLGFMGIAVAPIIADPRNPG